jgi:carboxypeptidase C (cathepsin A)
MRRLLNVAAVALTLLAASLGVARAEPPKQAVPAHGVLSLFPPPQTTEHSIDVHGHTLSYQARAGALSLLGDSGTVTADVFYVAYSVRSGQISGEAPQRPITFVFNGGPGAASAYLHLGALGPRIVTTSANGLFLQSPKLVDNPDTWLDTTDLVFVDPVGTGYSRAAAGQEARSFWGVNQDAASMASFIRLYLTQMGRLRSPVFLAGESYGGFRAALLARTLQQDVGVGLSGIVLISPALEFMLLRPDEFDLLHLALELPSLAAVRLQGDGVTETAALQKRLVEVERFALGDYLVALASGLEQGGRLASERVAEFTSLPLELVQRSSARISKTLFAKEFARARHNVLSLYDGTVETVDIAPNKANELGPDPLLDRSVPVLSSAFVAYVRDELNFHTDISYRLLNGEIGRNWDYGTRPSRQGYAGAMDDLERARVLNPALGVLIVNGYTDLVTPYMTSRYLVGQVRSIPGAAPIRLDVLEGGHMMYLRPDSRQALKEAASGLYRAAQ